MVDDFRKAVEAHEKVLLEAALSAHRFNQRNTAKALNLTYDQLRHAMRRLGML
jgi:psp operon transcriptional activator